MMVDNVFLPNGQVWIGFDESGKSIAASVEARKPPYRRGSVMEGCAHVAKMKTPSDGILFGRMISDFEAAQ